MPDKKVEHGHMNSNNQVKTLISELTCGEDLKCQQARERLVSLGRLAVPALIDALKTAQGQSRWELVKTLGEIADPSSAGVLIDLLTDEEFDIRWLAREGLSAIGYDTLKPLLESLVKNGKSLFLRNGAQHVLRHVSAEGHYTLLKPLLVALDDTEAELAVPIAAEQVLEKL